MTGQGTRPLLSRPALHAGEQQTQPRAAGAAPAQRDACTGAAPAPCAAQAHLASAPARGMAVCRMPDGRKGARVEGSQVSTPFRVGEGSS